MPTVTNTRMAQTKYHEWVQLGVFGSRAAALDAIAKARRP